MTKIDKICTLERAGTAELNEAANRRIAEMREAGYTCVDVRYTAYHHEDAMSSIAYYSVVLLFSYSPFYDRED